MAKTSIKRWERRRAPSELYLIKMSEMLRPKNRPTISQSISETKKFYRERMTKVYRYNRWRTRSFIPEEISCPDCNSSNIYFDDKPLQYNCKCEDCRHKFIFKPTFLCQPMNDETHVFKPESVYIQPHIEMFYAYCPIDGFTSFSIVIGKTKTKQENRDRKIN